MDDLLATILKDTYTLPSAKKRIRVLRTYLYQKFFGEAQAEPPGNFDMQWLNSLPAHFWEKFTKNNALSQLTELEQRINQIKPLTLYLAFEVNEEATRAIAQKARELFQPNLLLDIKLNPALLAGCALVWQGVFKDYSLKALIEARKMQILESFKKFLR